MLGLSFLLHPNSSLANETEDNEYIKQYYKERDSDNVDLEEEIILDALESYWQEDLKVGEILVNETNDLSIKPLVLSVEEEDKVKAIKIIESIYENVNAEEKELLYDYVVRHYKGIEDSEVLRFLEDLDAEKNENEISTFAAAASYKGGAAATWAYNNYNKYSKSYPKFTGKYGTNCTNFVSQAMHIGGGLPKQGKWTISRKKKYHVINSAKQLNYSWKLSDPSPWISVKEFSKFWRKKSTVRGASKAQYVNNTKSYRKQQRGDIVIFHKGAAGVVTVPTHAMIITQKPANDYNLAGNSVERRAHPLKKAIKSYSYIEFYTPK